LAFDLSDRDTNTAHPALQAFLDQLPDEILIGQVLLRAEGSHWMLRHVQNRDVALDSLRLIPVDELRSLAQFTADGLFRPLKSAPNLQAGWRARAQSPQELATALDRLYPGFLADWYAERIGSAVATHFRPYAERQSGMYRIVNLLTDAQAERVIQTCCMARFCLKRRCWTSADLALDTPSAKSIIPCLEPCAVFMEFARKAVRCEQAELASATLAPAEVETVLAALQRTIEQPDPGVGEADFASPLNARRLQWTLDKMRLVGQKQKHEHDSP
jgi:hypothetical protein